MNFSRFFRKFTWRKHNKNPVRSAYSLMLREKKVRRESTLLPAQSKVPLHFWLGKYKNIITGILLGCAVFFAVALVFFFSGFFAIQEIALTRKDLRVNVEGISRLLENVRGENLLILSKSSLVAAIQKKFPDVKTVMVQKSWPHTLQVIVETFPLAVRWHLTIPPEKDVLFIGPEPKPAEPVDISLDLNVQGQVVSTGADEQDNLFPIAETLANGEDPPDVYFGATIIPAEQLQQILQAKELLQNTTPFAIVSAEFFRSAREVHLQAKDGPVFWLDFFAPLPEQIEKIRTALIEVPLFEKNLRYIDLRIPGKVIYSEAPKS